MVNLDGACVGDDSSPDISVVIKGGGARITEPGVGELRVFDGLAIEGDGDGPSIRLDQQASGDVFNEEAMRCVADGGSEASSSELQFTADSRRGLGIGDGPGGKGPKLKCRVGTSSAAL